MRGENALTAKVIVNAAKDLKDYRPAVKHQVIVSEDLSEDLSKKMRARLIASGLEKNQLPKSWTYEGLDEMQGAQTINAARAISLLLDGDEKRDDWYRLNNYTHLALLDCSGFSGESGGLGYPAITEQDLDAMYVISKSTLREIGIDLMEAGYDIDPMSDWWSELDADDYEDILINRAEKVDPEWVTTI